ncbi:hypothetical protein Tco_1517301 [Tanacetum coccineum]
MSLVVMSSASSAVTYTFVYTDSKPGRDPDYVPEPIYHEYIPLEDEHVFSVKEQPLPPVVSPTTESPRYVVESDPEEDPKEDDADDEDKDEEEEEEHLALTDFVVVVPTVELVSPTEGTKPSPLLPSSRYEIRESSTARPIRGQGVDYEFVSIVDVEARRQGISEVRYGIRDTWIDLEEAVLEIAPMTVGEVNTRVTKLTDLYKHDTQDLYALLEDAQDSRSRISQRVDMDSQRVDLLMRDRMTLQETVWIVEEEAYAS